MAGGRLARGKAAACLMAAVLVVELGGCFGTAETESGGRQVRVAPFGPGRGEAGAAAGPITREELEQELRRFADRFAAREGAAIDRILAGRPTGRQRAAALYFDAAGWAATIEIATGSDAVANLLDMLVFVSLYRTAVETYWVPEVFGAEAGRELVEVARILYDDIWAISAKVLTRERQEDLRTLIRTWHEQHPDQHRIWTIRFGEFSGQRAAALGRVIKSGGLLRQVQRTRETVDEVRLFGERFLYYTERAPSLLQRQVQLAFAELADQPEVSVVLNGWERVSTSMEQLAGLAETLPERRLQAVQQLVEGVDQQRRALMEDLTSNAGVPSVLADLQQTLAMANELVRQTNDLTARLGMGEPNKKPPDPNEYRMLLAQTTEAASELRGLVQAADQLMASPAWEQRVPEVVGMVGEIGNNAQALLDRAFLLAVALVVVFFAVLLTYRLVSARLPRH